MAKKYLSLEEAAGQLGLSQEALKKAREQGDLRGFADRGNWKFREEDIEEYGRTLSVDSNPDLPIIDDEEEADLVLGFDENVLGGDDDDIGEQPTIIRKSGDSNVHGADDKELFSFLDQDEGASDSEVRMVLDNELTDSPKGKAAKQGGLKDSSQDIPLQFGDSSEEVLAKSGSSTGQDNEDSSVDIKISFGDSSQDMVLAEDPDERPKGVGDSDSDVRLAFDEDVLSNSDSAVVLGRMDSDSDVRLLGSTQPMRLNPGSDSDVQLIKTDSDSDVKLIKSGSDSDVRLLPSKKKPRPDSDSDISLDSSDDMPLALADSDDEDLSTSGFLAIGEGSDIKLGSDSGISLETGDSGISLDLAGDSGIALDTGTDSDISLAMGGGDDDDDGLTLDTAGDSGIALDLPDDSGLSLDGANMEGTVPMMKLGNKGKPKKSGGDTATLVNMPVFDVDDDEGGESDTDFELGALEGDSGATDTSVLLFDDEDDADDRGATVIKKKAASEHDETFDLNAGDEFDDAPEEELLGEDDELEEEGEAAEDFMADEDDFDEDLSGSEGQSSSAAATGAGMRMAPVEQEWHPASFALLMISALGMLFAAGVMFDLVRGLWKAGEYGVTARPLIDMLGIK